MKIYTKRGDKGQTRLANGETLSKSDLIFEVLGGIDELNSWVGLCCSICVIPAKAGILIKKISNSNNDREIRENLQKIQNNLFTINAILANSKNVKFDVQKETKWLEKEIDKMEKDLPPLKNFVLPGGDELAAMLHVARTVCRRAERKLVVYQHVNMMARKFIPYFNRLSDYLFTLARWVNYIQKQKEIIFSSQKSFYPRS